ncbi:helix-turn-helix domain-containing protein [Nocardia sp. NPDC052566]|uniref:helix-turn-helix domain-containing protein n=1 Tax=Nocardia sp. NPDC052566 TaxID=3364330 RepID=UPI0037C6A04D
MDPLDLLLHPVRLRIVHAMSGGRTRTTSELCAHFPDIPKTSLYRHVGLLAQAGVLEVADEQRVHGAVERHYRLRRDRATIDAESAATMSLDDHRNGFTATLAALHADFNAYLDRAGADPVADAIGYRQGIFWLTPEEHGELVAAMLETLRPRVANEPAPERIPYLMSIIQFPIEEAPTRNAAEAD